jgi:hypothetical protein
MTEIETVTVTFEEMKANRDHYLKVKETKRLVITHEGEQVMALGPWLPGEERVFPAPWVFTELFPPLPMDPDNPYLLTRALEATRGHRSFSSIRQR